MCLQLGDEKRDTAWMLISDKYFIMRFAFGCSSDSNCAKLMLLGSTYLFVQSKHENLVLVLSVS